MTSHSHVLPSEGYMAVCLFHSQSERFVVFSRVCQAASAFKRIQS